MSIGKVLEFMANITGFLFSLWLVYYGIKTWSLWTVVGLFVASAGAFNLGLYDILGNYLEARKAASKSDAADPPGAG
jgi:hypothetical protein